MDDQMKQSALVEDALRSQPMKEMPRSVKAEVMARIQKDKRPALFTWKDVVLALAIGLSLRSLLYAFENLPPLMLAKLRIQGLLIYRDLLFDFRWLDPAMVIVFAVGLTALFLPAMIRLMINGSR